MGKLTVQESQQKQVILSFIRRNGFDICYSTAKNIFDDLLSLQKLLVNLENEGIYSSSFIFTSDIEYLDLLWHEMILHTEFYLEHCHRHFARYLHHNPISDEAANADRKPLIASVERQIEMLTDCLGHDFIHRIYCEYPRLCTKRKDHA